MPLVLFFIFLPPISRETAFVAPPYMGVGSNFHQYFPTGGHKNPAKKASRKHQKSG
jgi:hypothetical protein